MSDHEFEKQVHQKLQELKLRPSDTVWMEVEKNIRQHKRRRRFLWLWSAALLVTLTTSGIVLYHFSGETRSTLEMANVTPAASSVSSNPTNNTVSPNSTNTNSNNTGTQASPIQPNPENSTAPASIEPTDASQPVGPSASNTTNQPGTTPAAAPETTQANTGLYEKKPAIAVTSKGTQRQTGNRQSVPLQSGSNRPRLKAGAIGAASKREQSAIGNKEKVEENSYSLPTGREGRVEATTVPSVAKSKETTEPDGKVDTATVEPVEQPDDLVTTVPALVNEAEPIITSKAANEQLVNSTSVLLTPDSATDANAIAAMPIQRKKASLWHWGVKADAGYSRISVSKFLQLRGLLGTEKAYAEDLSARSYASPNMGITNQFLAVSAAPVAVKRASPIQPDFSASVGVFIQRILSPRLKLSLGLEYSYMSVNTQVGKNFDAPISVNIGTNSLKVVPKYYESPGYIDSDRGTYATVQGQGQGWVYYSQKQRYRFHYIEVPLVLNWQINKGKKLPPLVFEGGLSVGHMFSVDALHYEGIKGVYYKDNSLFNKTQFNFVTGLSVGLFQNSKHPIWIGPDLRYSLNGLVKREVSTGQYMWSAGISFKMLLGRL